MPEVPAIGDKGELSLIVCKPLLGGELSKEEFGEGVAMFGSAAAGTTGAPSAGGTTAASSAGAGGPGGCLTTGGGELGGEGIGDIVSFGPKTGAAARFPLHLCLLASFLASGFGVT